VVTDYILVPGAWHGGWWYAPVVEELESQGHHAEAGTLAGLGVDRRRRRSSGHDI
jgi:hypothetical protein